MADIFPESREEEILVSMIDGEEYNKAPESRIEALLLELKEVIEEGGGGGGTTNYNLLQNKPSINSVTLTGNKSLEDLSIPTAADLAGKQDVLPVTASGNDVTFNGDIQDGQGNTLSVLAEALTKTASGNPVVITDCAGGKARSLITEINAIQDLHGYDKPWAGGAGKNKLEDTFNTGTLLDVDITADNGVIDLNGTGTGENSFAIKSRSTSGNYIYIPKGSYIFSAQGIGSGVVIGTTYNGAFSEIARNDSGESVSFSITDNTPSDYKLADGSVLLAVYITVHATTYNHQKVYPMIRLSSVVDDSFAPYSNICPISGRTAVVITRSDGDEISEDFTIQLGTTVYGAEINWDTGVGTVLWAIQVFTGADSENWDLSGNSKRVNSPLISDVIEKPADNNTVGHIISDKFKALTANETYTGSQGAGISIDAGNGIINVNDGTGSMTVAAWKTYLASNPLQVEYELATPTTIQLTPTQLEMLKGYNRVTIESGTITLDYIAKAISGNDEEIAPLVGDKATKSYAVNDFIERNDGLYRVTAPIASGASFTANNTIKMSIGEALTYLYNK